MAPIRCIFIKGLIFSLLVWTHLPSAAAAQSTSEKFAVDWAISFCKANERTHTALAMSDYGGSWCAWEFPSLLEARAEALRQCQSLVPAAMRTKVPCSIIYENGRIADPAKYAAHRKSYRLPIEIESYNGIEKTTELLNGYMVLGGAPSELRRTADIHLADGTRICVGEASLKRLRLNFDFKATCFGDQVFSGKAEVIGLRKIDGLQRLAFKMTIRNDPHFARIVSK